MKKFLFTLWSICLLTIAVQAQVGDCECDFDPEVEFICAQDADGNIYPVPNECFAACFELTVVDGECEPDFPEEGENEGEGWPETDCDCEDPEEGSEVCAQDEDGNIFPFPSACFAECFGLAVVDGECEQDWPDGDGEWPETDCDCPEPVEGEEVCVDLGDGFILPCPSACLAECYGYTVVEGECDWEGEWPEGEDGEWPETDCECEEPTEDDMVCVEDEFGYVFPFESACWAECFGLTVVGGECDWEGEWPEGEDGEWPETDCECEEPTEDDMVCVEDEFGYVFPFESACWAECFGLTVVEGECDWEGEWPEGEDGEWPETDCECEEPTEDDMVCVEEEGCIFPFPSACLAECFGLTIVDGECEHEWPEDEGEGWPEVDCECEEPIEGEEVCAADEDGNIFPFPSACWAECFGLTVVDGADCDFFAGDSNQNFVEIDESLIRKINSNNTLNFEAPQTSINALSNGIKLYPNPATATIQVEIDTNKDTATRVIVTDLSGKIVMNQSLKLVKGFNQEQLNISGLNDGIYQLEVASDVEVLTSKFVKM